MDDCNHDIPNKNHILYVGKGENNAKTTKAKSKKKMLFDYDSDSDLEVVENNHIENPSLNQSSSKEQSKLPSVVKLESSKEIEQPLPDPFVLPVHFRSDVEVCLSQGHMTREATTSFLSTVASKMFGYKKKPTTPEYLRVATDIIRKYPFMKPTDGDPTVCPHNVAI